jgi:hypothetical protein
MGEGQRPPTGGREPWPPTRRRATATGWGKRATTASTEEGPRPSAGEGCHGRQHGRGVATIGGEGVCGGTVEEADGGPGGVIEDADGDAVEEAGGDSSGEAEVTWKG